MSGHVVKKRTRYSKAHPHTYRCSCGWAGSNCRTDREAVRDAREHLGLLVPCPTCLEPVDSWCTRVGDVTAMDVLDRLHPKRLPCVGL